MARQRQWYFAIKDIAHFITTIASIGVFGIVWKAYVWLHGVDYAIKSNSTEHVEIKKSVDKICSDQDELRDCLTAIEIKTGVICSR